MRWSQSSLQAAEGGFGVAESQLLGHQRIHPLSRTHLAKQGLSRERGCAGGSPSTLALLGGGGTSLGATRRRVPIVGG